MSAVFPEAVGLDPEVYDHAAEIVEDRGYRCCSALIISAHTNRKPYNQLFGEMFRPEGVHADVAWWSQGETQPRVLALLLAAEIVRDANGDAPAELPEPAPAPAPQSVTFTRR